MKLRAIFLVFSILLTFLSSASATNYIFHTSGFWNEESNWNVYPGNTISIGDTIFIEADIIVNANITINGHLVSNEEKRITNNWNITVNGSFENNGIYIGNGQTTIFGHILNHGFWHEDNGTSIVTNTATFVSYGDLIIDQSMIGYLNSMIRIEGNLTNNGNLTLSSTLEIKHENGHQFINNGFVSFNGDLRLEGNILNGMDASLLFNAPSTITITDHSTLTNNGIITLRGQGYLSSYLNIESDLGAFTTYANLTIKDSIPQIL